jgi:hypothetical protein
VNAPGPQRTLPICNLAFGAAPEMPVKLSVLAAAIPATWVPCPFWSVDEVSVALQKPNEKPTLGYSGPRRRCLRPQGPISMHRWITDFTSV